MSALVYRNPNNVPGFRNELDGLKHLARVAMAAPRRLVLEVPELPIKAILKTVNRCRVSG